MIKKLFFCFVFLVFTNRSMAIDIEQIHLLHENQIDLLERRITEMENCIRYLRSERNEVKLNAVCSIFSRLHIIEEKENSKKRLESLNQAHIDYTALVEKGSVSAAQAETIIKQRNRIADLLDASADRVTEFLKLHDK